MLLSVCWNQPSANYDGQTRTTYLIKLQILSPRIDTEMRKIPKTPKTGWEITVNLLE